MIETSLLVDYIIKENPALVELCKTDDDAFLGLMRHVMIAGRGHHNPVLVQRLLKERLEVIARNL